MEENKPLSVDPLEIVALDGSEKFTYVSSQRGKRAATMHIIDVFAWNHSDMTGIDLMLTSHKLNVIPSEKPVRQKVRRFHPNHHQIIQTKVDNLLRAGVIREVKYPE